MGRRAASAIRASCAAPASWPPVCRTRRAMAHRGNDTMPRTVGLCLFLLALGLCSAGAEKNKPASAKELLERRFSSQVRPFLERYCHECHGPKKQKAAHDLSR